MTMQRFNSLSRLIAMRCALGLLLALVGNIVVIDWFLRLFS